MKVFELLALLEDEPMSAEVSVNMNRPEPNWLIPIDTVYSYENSDGEWVVEISCINEEEDN